MDFKQQKWIWVVNLATINGSQNIKIIILQHLTKNKGVNKTKNKITLILMDFYHATCKT